MLNEVLKACKKYLQNLKHIVKTLVSVLSILVLCIRVVFVCLTDKIHKVWQKLFVDSPSGKK